MKKEVGGNTNEEERANNKTSGNNGQTRKKRIATANGDQKNEICIDIDFSVMLYAVIHTIYGH